VHSLVSSPEPKFPRRERKIKPNIWGGRSSRPNINLASKENAMAKGQEKSNKEKKKPKADKNAPKSGGQSAYQQSKGGKK
jgi:hypothetical protein